MTDTPNDQVEADAGPGASIPPEPEAAAPPSAPPAASPLSTATVRVRATVGFASSGETFAAGEQRELPLTPQVQSWIDNGLLIAL